MPDNRPLIQMLDRALVNRVGKTGSQIVAESQKLDSISAGMDAYRASLPKSDPNYRPIKPTAATSAGIMQLTDDDLVDRIGKLLTAKDGASKVSSITPLGAASAGFGGIGLGSSYTGDSELKYSFDELINSGDSEAANQIAINLKNNLDEGNLDTLTEVKNNLQDIYNKSDSSAKKEITKLYEEVEQYYTGKADYEAAQQNLESYIESISLDQRMKDLDNVALNKDSGPISIKSPNLSQNDIINQYADHRSYRTGDVLYDNTYLKEFKTDAGKTEESLPKQAELAFNYNRNLYVSAANKSKELLNDYESLKNSIEKTEKQGVTVAQEAYDNLNRIKQEADYTGKLASKLESQANYYKFLHTFYPSEYEKKKAQDKQEVYKNTEQGWWGRFGESVYRGGQRVGANTLNTISGIQRLTGFNNAAFGNALASENIQPPPLYRAIDVNKDGKLQDSEYLKNESGDKISFDEVVYTTADGESHWNLWSAFEQTLPIGMDVITTIALSRGVGLAARGAGLSWVNAAKAARLSTSGTRAFLKSVAPRLSTFGNVYVTTFPRFYAEELKNFKDNSNALTVANLRAGIESLTETIIPETEFFKGRSNYGALDGLFKKLGKLDPTRRANITLRRDIALGLAPKNALNKTKAALLTAPSVIRRTLSGAAEETLEEELALFGNYFVDKYASSHNFSVEEANDLTFDNFLETAITGFIPSLFISGATNLVDSKKIRRNQARWSIANNPNLYLNRIEKQVSSGKITREEGIKRSAQVKQLESRLAAFEDISNIKNLSTLLDDKELQSEFFNAQLLTEEMLDIDVTDLTEEQKKNYDSILEEAAKTIQSGKDISYKYQGLSENEKQEIIANVFKKQAEAVTDPKTKISSIINARNVTNQYLNNLEDKDPRKSYIKGLYQDYLDTVDSQLVERLQGFQQMLEEDPSQVTVAELQLAAQFLLPALQDTGLLTSQAEDAIPFVGQGPIAAPEILTLVREELATRNILSEEEFYEELDKDLNNPEVVDYQMQTLPFAELSENELETGELEEGKHDHLPDRVKFYLGVALQQHILDKETNPDQRSALEEVKESATRNYYGRATQELNTPEEKIEKIRQMNARAFADEKARTTLVETEDGIKTQTEIDNENKKEEDKKPETKDQKKNTSNFKTEEQRKAEEVEEKEEEEETAYPRELNTEVFDKYRKARESEDIKLAEELSELENTPGAEEDVQNERAARRAQNKLGLSRLVLEQDSIQDMESALLGFNTEEAIQQDIIDFFNTVEEGKPDYTKAKFIDPKVRGQFKEKIEELLGNQPSREDNLPETTPEVENPFTDPTEDSDGAGEESVENSQKEAIAEKGKEKQVPDTRKDDLLYEISVRFDGFNESVVNRINDAFDGGVNPGINVTIQSPLNTFKSVLSPNRFARLQTLAQKNSLTEEEAQELKNLLTYNKRQLVDNKFLDFVAKNPKKALTSPQYVYSVLTNPEGEVLYFDRNGDITSKESGYPVLNPIRVNKQIIKQVEELGIVTSPVTGVKNVKGQSIKQRVESGKSKLYIHTDPTNTVIAGTSGGRFTLYKGFLYLDTPNTPYQYTGLDTPEVKGSDIYKLVQDFNEGKLDNQFKSETKEGKISEFLNLLKQTVNLKQVTDGLLFHPNSGLYFATTQEKTKVVFKRMGSDGKAKRIPQAKTTEKNVSAKEQLEGITFYKDISATRLESNQKFKAMYFENGNVKFKDFNNYETYLTSSEFGAVAKERSTLTFAENTVQLKETTSDNIDAIEENNPVDTQPDVTPVPEEEPTEVKDKTKKPTAKERRARLLNNIDATVDAGTEINPDELKRSKELGNKVTVAQNQAAKAWVESHPIFKNTPFIFNETIAHPEAYAVWSKAGVQLFEGANYAEAYHESWHEFSQLYLTPEQKEALYAEARKIWGDIPFVQLEENLAESFRSYALTEGKTLPKEIAKYKESKSIFKKIWDFIKNLVSDKKTIDNYFGKLYKGNLSQFTRKESNAYFKTLYSSKLVLNDIEGNPVVQSFKNRAKLIQDFDSLFVDVANRVLRKQNASIINVLQNPDIVNKIYANVETVIKSSFSDLREEYNTLQEEEIEDLELREDTIFFAELVLNLPTILNYHKKNSTLFDNKVRKNLISETLEDLNADPNTEGIGSFEASINEFSQKDLASDLVINSILTLPKYDNGEEVIHPKLGSTMVGDFESNWNILQRTLQGSTSYGEMYTRIKKITKDYPQFKTLLSYLRDPKVDIGRMSDLAYKNQFFNIFSMPYVDGATVEINEEKDDKGNVTSTSSKILRAMSLDAVSLRSEFDNDFNFNQGPFKTLTESGSYVLDFNSYFEQFPETPAIPAKGQPTDTFFGEVYAQLAGIGLPLNASAFEELKNKEPRQVQKALELIRQKLKGLQKSGENIFTPLSAISKQHKEDSKTVKGEVSSLNFFLNTYVEANPEYANDMRYNPVNKKIWIVNQHTFMSKVLNALNDSKSYPTLKDVQEELPHLDTNVNTNPRGSFILRYLFDESGNRRMLDGKPRTIDLVNFLGVKENSKGEKLIDTSESLKHYLDIIGLTKGGIEEFNRLSGKNTTRGFSLTPEARRELGLLNPYGETFSFLDENGQERIPFNLFIKHILPIIKSEVDTHNNPSPSFNIEVKEEEKKDKKDKKESVPQLSYFRDIFSGYIRTKLVNDLKDLEGKSIEETVRKLPYANDIYIEFLEYIKQNTNASLNALGNYSVSKEDLLKYHFASFVLRVEQFKMFFNHPYFYKNAKDIEKRISAWNAFGSYPVLDEQNIRSLELSENKPYAQEDAYVQYAIENGLKVVKRNKDLSKINYLVFKDNPVVSETAKNNPNYSKVVDAYTKDKKSATQDAAAVATMDFYRRAFALSTGLTPAMEKEFARQNKIWSLHLKLKNASDLDSISLQEELDKLLNQKPFYKFIIKKFQYSGQNKSPEGKAIPIFHKYSIKPLIPSEAVQNERTAEILEKLMSSGADYGVFNSGTKVSETTPAIPLFDSKGKVNKTAKKPGSIDMKYFKEQVLVENKETFKLVFSTQLRKLIYKDASSPTEVEAYNLYKKYMDSLVNYDKALFLENMESKEKLVEFIVNELSKKGAADATKDLIKLKENGELHYVLDSFVDRTVLESAIVSSVKNKIIRQKVNGVQRVQFPVSLMSDRKLKYYDLEDGKVTKAETIISFSSNYYPLFNLEFNGEKIGELDASGNPINVSQGLVRLNEALNDEDFVKDNERALTVSAIRIPGQGYNSMENFTIVEFLPEESGEIILVPDEMVVKSGSDYDIDKLFTYEPFLSRDGVARGSELSTEESLKRKSELEKELEVKKVELGDYLKEKRQTINDIQEFLDGTGFDKASDIYKEVKRLKAEKIEDESELEFTGEVNPAEALKRKFEGGESVEDILGKKVDQTKRNERKAKIRQLSEVLTDYSEQKLGFYLSEAVKAIEEVKEEIAEVKANLSQVRNGLANNILFNVSDRLTQEEIFDDLITPNEITLIEDAAEKLTKEEKKNPLEEASYTNTVNPLYQKYVFSLNSYKKSLGTDAKNNVLHSILQKSGIYIEDDLENSAYVLKANLNEQGKVTFTGKFDTNGRPISLIQGQMISAHVDIEKNDDIARIGLNNVVTPVVNYMMMAGTPFEDAVNLITRGSNIKSSILEFSKNPDIQEFLERPYTDPRVIEFIEASRNKKGRITISNFFKEYKRRAKNVTKETFKKEIAELSEYGDFLRLATFLKMRDQANNMATLSLATDYDTFSPQNFESFTIKDAEVDELMNKGFFNKEGVLRVKNDSIVSNFKLDQDIFKKLDELFPVSTNKQVSNAILGKYNELKKSNRFLDYDMLSRVFKNDFVYYLYANNTDQVTKYQSLLDKRSEKHIKTMYDSLKLRLENLGIKSENKIFDLARFNTSEKTSYIRTGLRQTSFDYDVNYYREEFEAGLNYSHPELDPSNEEHGQIIDDMREWFEAFAIAGIIGTNLNKRFDSYLPIIPESLYTNYANDALRDFTKKSIEGKKSILAEFSPKFTANHPELVIGQVSEENQDLLYFKDYIGNATAAVIEEVETAKPETPTSQLDLFAQTSQAAQDSLDAIREKNRKNKENC